MQKHNSSASQRELGGGGLHSVAQGHGEGGGDIRKRLVWVKIHTRG